MFTPANVADNNHGLLRSLLSGLSGKCAGDKGYQRALFEEFCERGMHLLVRPRRGMRSLPVGMEDSMLLRKRPLIESVNDILATVCDVEHSRHRRSLSWACQHGGCGYCIPVPARKTAPFHTRRSKLSATSRLNSHNML